MVVDLFPIFHSSPSPLFKAFLHDDAKFMQKPTVMSKTVRAVTSNRTALLKLVSR